MQDRTARWLSTAHARVFRFTGGRTGKRLVNHDMLLLTTVGRLSGSRHTIPLLYLRDNDRLVIIASWGGRDYPPALVPKPGGQSSSNGPA